MKKVPVLERPGAVVTCGPGIAPIDAVRCITNHSTGELGVLLADRLARAGWEVTCVKSVGALFRDPCEAGVRVRRFATNAEVCEVLQAEPERDRVRAVFHVAALCDYEVSAVETSEGNALPGGQKISSEHAEIRLTLRRAPKVLPKLGMIFPNAQVVGWKLEWSDDRVTALERGMRQLEQNAGALCVVNGPAYGSGFGVLHPGGNSVHVDTKAALCDWLTEWAARNVGTLQPTVAGAVNPRRGRA
jgi:phosphopantothenoylcysteine decarboxylase/phosphopantothenate--cysteine ligase